MNVSSRCWSLFHTNECVFSRNEQQKVYSFNLFKVTSSSNDDISTAFIAITNSYDEISTWIV